MRIIALGVDWAIWSRRRDLPLASGSTSRSQHGKQRAPLNLGGSGNSRCLQDGRKNVDQLHSTVDSLSRGSFCRQFEQQWYVDGLLVEKDSMSRFPVFTQSFAVV